MKPTHRLFAGLTALAVAAGGASLARAAFVTDAFSDLNDTANPTWTHLSGLANSTGQTWDASAGQYHLNGATNGQLIGANGNIGFVGSYTGADSTNVRVSADFVGGASGVAYGLAARLNANNGFNALKGYAYAYEPLAAGGLGEMVLYRINGLSLSDIGSQQVTLDIANKDYTFVLEIIGDQLHGQVFEIGGGMVAEKFATHAEYANGYSGIFGYSASAVGAPIDFTIDNFGTGIPEPAAGVLMAAAVAGVALMRRRRA